MTIYFKNDLNLEQFKLISPSQTADNRSPIVPESGHETKDVTQNGVPGVKEGANESSGFFHTLGKTLALVTMTITVIPLLVKLVMHLQNNKETACALRELEKLKWKGFFGPRELEPVIKAVHGANNAPQAAKTFIEKLPASDFPDLSIKEEILKMAEKGHLSEAFKKLKEHYQIINFYRACKEGKTSLVVLSPSNRSKIHDAFETAKSYMQGSRNSPKELKEVYQAVTNVQSSFLTKSWINAIYQRGEISLKTKEELLILIDAGNGPAFIEKLKECVADRIQSAKEKGPNIGYYFYKEMWDVLVRIDSKKGIRELGNHLAPLFYYQNIYAKLAAIESGLSTLTIPEESLADYLQEIKKTLKEGDLELISSIGSDLLLPPSFDYQFRSAVGLIRRKMTHINDILEKREENAGIAHESHDLCGCHHAYSHEDLEKEQSGKPVGLFPKQVVDIKKGRISLEKRLKALDAKIEKISSEGLASPSTSNDSPPLDKEAKIKKLQLKREALIADIAALKLSEKGCGSKRTKKPIVMGFTCSFGSGHKAPTAAVAKILGNESAHFTVADGPDDILKPLCGLHKIGKVFGKEWKKSDAFAYILQKQWYWLPRLYLFITKLFAKIAALFTGKPKERPKFPQDTPEKELLRKRILMEMPDHLMTFYHMDLNEILEVAEEMGLPTTHFATDFSAKMNESFGNLPPTHPMFQLMVTNDTAKSLESASPVKPGNIVVTSGAVRPLFHTKTDKETLDAMRAERGIDQDTSTILFMGGGFGQSIDYPEKIASDESIKEKMHLIVIAGANKAFGQHFEEEVAKGRLTKHGKFYKGANPNITIEVAQDPATKSKNTPFFIGEAAMSRYFDLADVLYTKPGGSTTLEALVKGVTTVFDNRTALMEWEEDNMRQTIALGYGIENTSEKEFLSDLREALKKAKSSDKKGRELPQVGEMIHRRFKQIHEKNPNSWQESKFSHYRFDLPIKPWENECILI